MKPPERTAAWKELQRRAREMRGRMHGRMGAAPRSGGGRNGRLRLALPGILAFDYSRQCLDGGALAALCALARARELPRRIAALFRGEAVNFTERLPALHPALRAARPQRKIAAERRRFLAFAQKVRCGGIRGAGGRRFAAAVNIGIGGSELGAKMALCALEGAPGTAGNIGDNAATGSEQALAAHFASGLDGGRLAALLPHLVLEQTLFVVASKSFATRDTMLNAELARRELGRRLSEAALRKHFAAVSANLSAMRAFGIAPSRRFRIFPGVGGRFSLWSAMGLIVALRHGTVAFEQLLAGAREMDRHFRTAPIARNLPVVAALLDLWNVNLAGAQSRVVLSYDYRLRQLAPYLAQLEMESLGKTATRDGTPAALAACVPVWGGSAFDARHSFFQMLHQGRAPFAAELVVVAAPAPGETQARRREVLRMARRHSERFAGGRDDADPHRRFPGARPHSVIRLAELSPRSLGGLLAFYEHKVFALGALYGINPFDQRAVDSGKE